MYALSLLNKDLFLIRVCSLRAGVLGGWKWRPQGGGGGGRAEEDSSYPKARVSSCSADGK